MPAALSRRATELAATGEPFVTATVVRVQRPASAAAGDVALVLGDGTIEGFVGGSCAEHSVRANALAAIASGEPVLLRILPFNAEGEGEPPGPELAVEDGAREDGAVTVQNPCLSGGAIEVFLEPVLPAPRVLVVGETPIAGALLRIGPELGLEVVAVSGADVDPRGGDLALVVAAHGRDELHALRRGLEAGLSYVGLVASAKRGAGVIGELRGDGVPREGVERIDVPAGIEIGARTPAEIALSILAAIVAVRRERRSATSSEARSATSGAAGSAASGAARPATPSKARSAARAGDPAPGTAVDPVCGMTVAAVANTPSLSHEGEPVYFCCEGCRAAFEKQHEHAA